MFQCWCLFFADVFPSESRRLERPDVTTSGRLVVHRVALNPRVL